MRHTEQHASTRVPATAKSVNVVSRAYSPRKMLWPYTVAVSGRVFQKRILLLPTDTHCEISSLCRKRDLMTWYLLICLIEIESFVTNIIVYL